MTATVTPLKRKAAPKKHAPKLSARHGNTNAKAKVEDPNAPPWAKWRGSDIGKRIRWIRSYCVVPRGVGAGSLVKLLPFQTEFIEELYATGVQSAGLSCPRGQAKTTLLAMVGLAELHLNQHSPDVSICATTQQQSARPSGVFGIAKRMTQLNPELSSRSLTYSGVGDPRITVPRSDGLMAPIAARDADALLGLSSSLLIADEFGADFWTAERWGALVQSLGKRGSEGRAVGISTPNSKRSAMYDMRGKALSGTSSPSTRFIEYAAPDGAELDDRSAWHIANPALGHFLDITALEADLLERPAWLFRQMRLGQWEDATEGWLGSTGPDAWDATTTDVTMSETAETWLGVDKSMRDDCSAVAILQRDGERWRASVRIFRPDGAVIDHAAVRDHIRETCRSLNVVAVGFDPRFMVESAQELAIEGWPMVEVAQSLQRMTPAYSALHRDIIGRLIDHDDDPELRAHVLSAVPQVAPSGGFVLSKGKSRQKIDGCVSLAIARSLTLHEEPPVEPLDLTEVQMY